MSEAGPDERPLLWHDGYRLPLNATVVPDGMETPETAALRRERDGLRAALAKIAAETPGDTGVDCGRPGGDCRRCEDMIETADAALKASGGGEVADGR